MHQVRKYKISKNSRFVNFFLLHGTELVNFVQDKQSGALYCKADLFCTQLQGLDKWLIFLQNNQSILYKTKRPSVLFYGDGLFCTIFVGDYNQCYKDR